MTTRSLKTRSLKTRDRRESKHGYARATATHRTARRARAATPRARRATVFAGVLLSIHLLTTLANAVAHNDASRRRPASAASATRRARGRSRARALERSTDRSPSSARPFARAPTDRPRVESTGRRASPPAARRASRRRPSRVDRARRPRASLRFRITRKTFRLPRADARHRPRVRHKTPHFRARELQRARSASRPRGRAASRAGRDAQSASRARTDARPTRAPIERARARRTADARRRRDARERARRRRTTSRADADGARVRDRRVDRARRRERRLLGADRDAEDGHEQRVRGELGADARVAAVREHVGVPRMARRRQRRRDASRNFSVRFASSEPGRPAIFSPL